MKRFSKKRTHPISYSANMKCYYSSQNINSDNGRLRSHVKIIPITLLFLFVYTYSLLFLRICCCKLRVYVLKAGPPGRSVKGIGLRPFACFVVGSHPAGCVDVFYISNVVCLCDELITRSEEFYRQLCVILCNLETSSMRGP